MAKQYISWIHLADLTQMFMQAIEPENYFDGTYNAVAPIRQPMRNSCARCGAPFIVPWCPPAPAWAVKLGSPADAKPSRRSRWTVAAARQNVFVEAGFKFQFRTCAAR